MNHREVAVPDVVGGSLVLHYVIAPLGDRPPYSGTVMTAVNVTVETRAGTSASRALLVAEMTEQMNAGVDPDAALQALTDRLVPDVADLAAVYITAATPPEGGQLPSSVAVAFTLDRTLAASTGPPPPASPRAGGSPWDAALAAGQTVLISVAELPRRSTDPASAAWLQAAQAHSIAVTPLVVAGELAGALLRLGVADRPAYDQADVLFFEDVTARAGAAIAHLRSYQQ